MSKWIISTIISIILAVSMHLFALTYLPDYYKNKFNTELDSSIALFEGKIIYPSSNDKNNGKENLNNIKFKYHDENTLIWLCRFEISDNETAIIEGGPMSADFVLSVYDYKLDLQESYESYYSANKSINLELSYSSEKLTKSNDINNSVSDGNNKLILNIREGLVIIKTFIYDKAYKGVVMGELESFNCKKK